MGVLKKHSGNKPWAAQRMDLLLELLVVPAAALIPGRFLRTGVAWYIPMAYSADRHGHRCARS